MGWDVRTEYQGWDQADLLLTRDLMFLGPIPLSRNLTLHRLSGPQLDLPRLKSRSKNDQ